jgi:AraC-like DNA-binding protein
VHLHIRDGRAELMGVVRGTYSTTIEGVGYVIGVRFRPGGFYPFVRQPVSRWTDKTVCLDEIVSVDQEAASRARNLWNMIGACDGDAKAQASIAAAQLDALLIGLHPASDSTAEEMASLVAAVSASRDVRRVADLVRASGRSERTLHRLFLRYVGVTPAWVIRRYRLHTAAERLTTGRTTDLQGLAYELGYADQAHFIRDFRATIGITPGEYVAARR